MYAGHFAVALLLHSFDSSINSFLLTFGVVFTDIIMAILTYFCIEGLELNMKTDGHCIDLHVPISHSLISAFFSSCLWSVLSLKHFQVLFIASFSHFMLDWFVHNQDLQLYPFSNIFVGGTRLSSKSPRLAYSLELLLCLFCCLYSFQVFGCKTLSIIAAVCYVLYLQCYRALSIGSELYMLTTITPRKKKGELICQSMVKAFVIPAIVFGILLEVHRFTHY